MSVIVIEFITLDGIVSDPDGSGGTPAGGWAFRHGPETVAGDKFRLGRTLDEGVLLLGRSTWQLFSRLWPGREDPFSARMNAVPKLVASRTLTDMLSRTAPPSSPGTAGHDDEPAGLVVEPVEQVPHSDTGHMPFRAPPSTASWQHREARSGFEVAYFQAADSGWIIEGTTAAVEDGQTWVVTYSIALDAAWVTRRAQIGTRTVSGSRETQLESDGYGRWLINGAPAPGLDGCLDVDLESSAMTNTLPVHRLDLPAGAHAAAPAAYVRALDLTVERLEQTYLRIADQGAHHRYNYSAPAFGFTSRLVYDENGLVIDCPGIAQRAR